VIASDFNRSLAAEQEGDFIAKRTLRFEPGSLGRSLGQLSSLEAGMNFQLTGFPLMPKIMMLSLTLVM
jgi:hypothetical protein